MSYTKIQEQEEQKITYKKFGITKTVYNTRSLPEIPKMIILNHDTKGFKAGTVGICGGDSIQSGYNMTIFIPIDHDYQEWMTKNGYETLRDYILDQHESNFAFGSQYWKNPFHYTHIYKEDFLYVDDLEKLKKKNQEKMEKLEREAKKLDLLISESNKIDY